MSSLMHIQIKPILDNFDLPVGALRPIAVVESSASELSEWFMINFERLIDDLDYYQIAILENPNNGKFYFEEYENAPVKGVVVSIEQWIEPTIALSELTWLLQTLKRTE